MSKNKKIIISGILCVLIILGTILILIKNNSNTENKKSKQFINAISYIQEEKYENAYKEIKKSSNKNEIEIIQTIFLYKFGDEFEKNTEIVNKISDETEHINDYLTYTYLYSKDDSYQQKIDKIYNEEYSKLYDIKDKMPVDIMFDDTKEFYKTYFEYLDLANGLFKNYEYNVINNQQGLLNKVTEVDTKLKDLSDKYDKLVEKHPSTIIPEEYLILLDMTAQK